MEFAIKGHGSENASVMLISDYPTKQELIKGYALSESTGDFIDKLFAPHGFRLSSCYRTTYIKEPIEGYGYSKKRDKEILTDLAPRILDHQQLLCNEIEAISPNVVVPLGELALNFIAGERRIDKFRGSVLPLGPEVIAKLPETFPRKKVKVIPLFHPRDVFQDWSRKVYTQLDAQKVAKWKDNPEELKEKYCIWVCRDVGSLNNYLSRNSFPKFGTVDIETHHGFITCIGFCFDGKEAISVPLMDEKMPMFERAMLFKRIARALRDPMIRWVNQNIKYDITVNRNFGLLCRNVGKLSGSNVIGDTMLLSHTIYPELPKGLDFLTSIYTDIPYYKDEGKEFDPKLGHTYDQLYLYNAKDALATWIVWEEQLKELEEPEMQDVKHFFFDVRKNPKLAESPMSHGNAPQGVMPCFHFYQKMDERGIRVDEMQRKILISKYEGVLEEFQARLSAAVGFEFNPRSPQQVQKIVYDYLECPKHYKTNRETGQKTLDTGRETLEVICFNESDPSRDEKRIGILKNIIYARKASKIVKWLNTPIHPDGRWRAFTKLAGTKTGRTSQSTTVDKLLVVDEKGSVNQLPDNKKNGLGASFQTVPKHGFIDEESEEFDAVKLGDDVTSIFVPSPGYIFMDGDKSQVEARIVAVLAEDWEILEAFEKPNSYIHRLTASWIYRKPPDEIKKKTNEYDMGKRSRHGGNYDMQAFRFSRMCHIPIREADIILLRFHENSPKIRGIFHAGVRTAVQRDRSLVNIYGRKRDFFGRIDDKTFKDAYSWEPQSINSDHTKFACCRVYEQTKDFAHIVMEAHDNVVAEVKKDQWERYAQIYKKEMEAPYDFRFIGTFIRDFVLNVPVELAKSSTNLYEMKEFKL